MASMTSVVATLAAVPAGLRTESLDSSIQSSSSTVLMGQRKAAAPVSIRRSTVAARASASEQVYLSDNLNGPHFCGGDKQALGMESMVTYHNLVLP